MKRILVFTTAYLPFVGGAEIALHEILKRVPDAHFHIVTARLSRKVPRHEEYGNVTITRIGIGIPIVDKFLLVLRGLWGHADNVDIVWSMMASYGGFAGMFFANRNPEVRFLLTLQEGDDLEAVERKVRLVWPWFVRIFTRADRIQAISSYLGQWAEDMGHRHDPVIIPNGVDVKKFGAAYPVQLKRELREYFDAHKDTTVLIHTGRLVKKNGVEDIIVAISKLPEHVHLWLLGDGVLRNRLEKRARGLGVAHRIHFMGLVAHQELPLYLQSADIFIRPSLTEGMGNSFIEAMAAGVPVIATPVGGILDFLDVYETGMYCKPQDPVSIVEAVRELMGDEKLRARLIKNGKALVKSEYDWEIVGGRMRKFMLHL